MSPRGINKALGLNFGICIPVKTENYRTEVPDSRRRSTSEYQVSFKSRSLLLVDLYYGYRQMSQMSFQEKLVVLTRFSPSLVGSRRDLLSSGAIGSLPMGQLRSTPGTDGSYYLASSTPNQWLPIGDDGKKRFGKLDVLDDKKRGVMWGLPSSHKYWKGAWFFVSGDWGRSLPADREKSLSEAYVPCLFTQTDIFIIGLTCLCFYSVYRASYHFFFIENSVAASVDAYDSEEEPLLRPSSAKGKGPIVQEEEGPPKSMGGDGAEVRMDVTDGSRGILPLLLMPSCIESSGMVFKNAEISWTRTFIRGTEVDGPRYSEQRCEGFTNYRSEVSDSRRRSTSDDQVSVKSRSLLLVDLHYGYMQMSRMSFQEARSLFLTCLRSSGVVRVGDGFREARGTHKVLAVFSRQSPRPPFL
ncbi:hypothetical protein ACOSQ2_002619 [Xanthoceras sorbifolium]